MSKLKEVIIYPRTERGPAIYSHFNFVCKLNGEITWHETKKDAEAYAQSKE